MRQKKINTIYILIIFAIMQKYKTKKQIIGNHFSSLYLTQSKFYIDDNFSFSITMWIRILTSNLSLQETTLLELRNDLNQFLQLIIKNDGFIYVRDETLVD